MYQISRTRAASHERRVEAGKVVGGAVLAANHLSGLDPPLVGSYSRRAIWYMMKSELLDIPVVGEALTWTGAFPSSWRG